jgi:Ras homolog enriched in brain
MINQVNDLLLNTLGDAPDVPRVLVGSMKDLSDQRQVNHAVSRIAFICKDSTFHGVDGHRHFLVLISGNFLCVQDAQRLADSWGVPYIECSSKSGECVAEVFHTLMKEIEKDDGLLTETNEAGCVIQ